MLSSMSRLADHYLVLQVVDRDDAISEHGQSLGTDFATLAFLGIQSCDFSDRVFLALRWAFVLGGARQFPSRLCTLPVRPLSQELHPVVLVVGDLFLFSLATGQ